MWGCWLGIFWDGEGGRRSDAGGGAGLLGQSAGRGCATADCGRICGRTVSPWPRRGWRRLGLICVCTVWAEDGAEVLLRGNLELRMGFNSGAGSDGTAWIGEAGLEGGDFREAPGACNQ